MDLNPWRLDPWGYEILGVWTPRVKGALGLPLACVTNNPGLGIPEGRSILFRPVSQVGFQWIYVIQIAFLEKIFTRLFFSDGNFPGILDSCTLLLYIRSKVKKIYIFELKLSAVDWWILMYLFVSVPSTLSSRGQRLRWGWNESTGQ
jgi:hypothetical protein